MSELFERQKGIKKIQDSQLKPGLKTFLDVSWCLNQVWMTFIILKDININEFVIFRYDWASQLFF